MAWNLFIYKKMAILRKFWSFFRYGYITTTKNKLIIVVDDYDVKEHEIKQVWRFPSHLFFFFSSKKNSLIIIIDIQTELWFIIKCITCFHIYSFQLFKQFHGIFADAVCNPFYTPDEQITSRKFDNQIISFVKAKSPESQVAPETNYGRYLEVPIFNSPSTTTEWKWNQVVTFGI